jgi:hypothetical protein
MCLTLGFLLRKSAMWEKEEEMRGSVGERLVLLVYLFGLEWKEKEEEE